MSCEEKKIELHLLQFHVDGIGVVSSTSFMYLFIFFYFALQVQCISMLNILYYPSTIKTRKKQREGEDFDNTLY